MPPTTVEPAIIAAVAPASSSSTSSSSSSVAASAVVDHVDPASFIFSAGEPSVGLLQQALDSANSQHEDEAAEGVEVQTAAEPVADAATSAPPSPLLASSAATSTIAFDIPPSITVNSSPLVSSSQYTLHSPVNSTPGAATPAPEPATPPTPIDPYDELQSLPSDHPLLASANSQLLKALKEQDVAVSAQLATHQQRLSALEKDRTELGVQLYSHQQQLAKSQMGLEKAVSGYNKANNKRKRREDEVQQLSTVMLERREAVNVLEAQRAAVQQQVDTLHLSIRAVQQYQTELKDELLVNKARTDNEELAITTEEKRKAEQDALIMTINEKLATADRQQQTLTLQIDAQNEENRKILTAIAELQNEVRLSAVEAKEYLERWRYAVKQIEVKQQAISLAEQTVEKLRETIRALSLQILHTQKQTRAAQGEHEQLVGFHMRLESEAGYLASQCDMIDQLRAKYGENYAMIVKSIAEYEEELKKHNYTNMKLESETSSVIVHINQLNNRRNEMEESKMNKINEELVLEHNSEHLWKQIRTNKRQIHTLESSYVEIANEMARMKIDIVNTNNHNQHLDVTKSNYMVEIQKRDELIDKYEIETTKRHDLIAKKQNEIIRLNKELEKIHAANLAAELSESVNFDGPLEILINNMKKKINGYVVDKEAKQKEWMKVQTEIVTLNEQIHAIERSSVDLSAQHTVYSNQNSRLAEQAGALLQTEQALLAAMKQMRTHGGKMNEWIEQFAAKRSALENDNYYMQLEFARELKEKESAAQAVADETAAIVARKEAVKQHKLNTVYAVEQMQTKLELERETQALLDPSVGQAEITALRKDNTALEAHIAALRKELDRRRADMDRLIVSSVKQTHVVTPVNSKQAEQKNRAIRAQHIAQTKDKVRRLRADKERLQAELTRVAADSELVQSELQRQQLIHNDVELRAIEADKQAALTSIDVTMAKEARLMAQNRVKKYEERRKKAEQGRDTKKQDGANSAADEDEDKRKLRRRLEKEREQGRQRYAELVDEVRRLREEQPTHRDWLDRLLAWVEV